MSTSHNERHRFGSGGFANDDEKRRAGLFSKEGSLFGYDDSGRSLRVLGDAPKLSFSGSAGGKSSQIILPEILTNPTQCRAVLDPRGEIVSCALPALATAGVYARIWNPTHLHGTENHPLQCLDILQLGNETFHADCDFIAASLIPLSGASGGRYFELRSREWMKNIMKALVERDGYVSFPSLWRAISTVEGDPARWADLVEFMLYSTMDGVRRTAGEMLAKQQDSPREFGGVMGELYSHFSFLDDPMLQASLENPKFSLAGLCNQVRPASLFLVVPIENISVWSPVLRTVFTVLMLYKSRAPSASRIQLLMDEASQLGHFDALMRAVTFGRGQGISTWNFFQDVGQITRHYGKEGLQTFMGSSQLRQFFGVRDFETAKMISDMLGHETLEFDDTLQQEAARRERMNAAMAFLKGSDPMRALNNMRSYRFGEKHRSKQARLLMTPDEVMSMPENRQIAFISGKNLRPVYAHKFPYFERREFAGKYLANPFHPPANQVRVSTRWGPRLLRVISEPVPPAFAHLPQYEGGTWQYVEGYRPKPRRTL